MNKVNNQILVRQKLGWAKIKALKLFFSTDKTRLSNRQFFGETK